MESSIYTSLEDNFENEDEVHLEPSDYGANEAEPLRPTPEHLKTWTKRHIGTLWISMVIDLPSYLIGAGLVSTGMTWYIACITVLFGNMFLWIAMAMNGHVGTKFGIPFPVFIRSVYGYKGAKIAALARAIVACGWFGIQTYIGGQALYQLLVALSSRFENSPSLGGWMGINLAEFTCFLIFWGINIVFAYRGLESIKKLQFISTPILVLMAISLFIWAWAKVGSFSKILRASEGLENETTGIIRLTLSSVTGVVGSWAALALNIMDFTRFTSSQKDQMLGQLYTLPVITTLVAFLGIFVTSATVSIYGEAIWNPIQLIGKMGNTFVIVIAMFLIVLATITTNIPANMVSPAIYFASLSPNWISFQMGILITGIIGILLLPWKLLADPNSYIYKWLIASSGGLGAITGVMICDYWLIRNREISLDHIYKSEGKYEYFRGYNLKAFFATGVAIAPAIPGFIDTLLELNYFPDWLLEIYDYAWFTSLIIAFPVYYIANRIFREKSGYEVLEEKHLNSVVHPNYS